MHLSYTSTPHIFNTKHEVREGREAVHHRDVQARERAAGRGRDRDREPRRDEDRRRERDICGQQNVRAVDGSVWAEIPDVRRPARAATERASVSR